MFVVLGDPAIYEYENNHHHLSNDCALERYGLALFD
jgi:hypothetical protein